MATSIQRTSLYNRHLYTTAISIQRISLYNGHLQQWTSIQVPKFQTVIQWNLHTADISLKRTRTLTPIVSNIWRIHCKLHWNMYIPLVICYFPSGYRLFLQSVALLHLVNTAIVICFFSRLTWNINGSTLSLLWHLPMIEHNHASTASRNSDNS